MCVCVCFTFLFLSDLIKYITTSCTYTIELCLLSPSVQYDVSLSLCVVAVHQTSPLPLYTFLLCLVYILMITSVVHVPTYTIPILY